MKDVIKILTIRTKMLKKLKQEESNGDDDAINKLRARLFDFDKWDNCCDTINFSDEKDTSSESKDGTFNEEKSQLKSVNELESQESQEDKLGLDDKPISQHSLTPQ